MKDIFRIIVALGLFFNLSAQNNNDVKRLVLVGINAGPNHNTLRGDSFAERFENNFGYFAGLSLEFEISENISVLTNINYENKSYKSEFEGFGQTWNDTFTVKEKTKFSTLNIPLLVKYKFGFENEFFVNGGVFYNHFFNITNEMINTETNEDISNLDFNELFKDKDYGLSLGVGMTFRLSEISLLNVEVRDDFGLNDIGDTSLGGISKSFTNTIKLILNWSFKI